jgi:hypothetical protein
MDKTSGLDGLSHIFTPFDTPFDTLDLRDPRGDYAYALKDANREPASDVSEPGNRKLWENLQKKARAIWLSLSLWLLTFIFFVLYSISIYRILLKPDPRVGNLLLSASDTNLLISILSQVFAQLLAVMVNSLLDALRWQLAARTAGVSFSTFFQLSSATNWTSVLLFTVASKLRNLWGVFRYLLLRRLSWWRSLRSSIDLPFHLPDYSLDQF